MPPEYSMPASKATISTVSTTHEARGTGSVSTSGTSCPHSVALSREQYANDMWNTHCSAGVTVETDNPPSWANRRRLWSAANKADVFRT